MPSAEPPETFALAQRRQQPHRSGTAAFHPKDKSGMPNGGAESAVDRQRPLDAVRARFMQAALRVLAASGSAGKRAANFASCPNNQELRSPGRGLTVKGCRRKCRWTASCIAGCGRCMRRGELPEAARRVPARGRPLRQRPDAASLRYTGVACSRFHNHSARRMALRARGLQFLVAALDATRSGRQAM
jgi:hypothetical protein